MTHRMPEGGLAESAHKDRCCRDTDLYGAKEPVGVADQLSDAAATTTVLGKCTHLALAQ